jgi:hypothetical protein
LNKYPNLPSTYLERDMKREIQKYLIRRLQGGFFIPLEPFLFSCIKQAYIKSNAKGEKKPWISD